LGGPWEDFYIVARCGWVWLSNISSMGFDKKKKKKIEGKDLLKLLLYLGLRI
jgi:hypothetical protein